MGDDPDERLMEPPAPFEDSELWIKTWPPGAGGGDAMDAPALICMLPVAPLALGLVASTADPEERDEAPVKRCTEPEEPAAAAPVVRMTLPDEL